MATVARRYTAVVYQEENWYVAECPEVGTASQGKTIEEAVANLKEATELYLEDFTPPEGAGYFLTSFAVDVRA
jgi:predicted RNase H-like HicB family nuclease